MSGTSLDVASSAASAIAEFHGQAVCLLAERAVRLVAQRARAEWALHVLILAEEEDEMIFVVNPFHFVVPTPRQLLLG